MALCGVASATSVEGNITPTAIGLDQFEGELIELGDFDPPSDAGFEVLDIPVIKAGDATLSIPVSEPMQVKLNLLAVERMEGLRARVFLKPAFSHQLRRDNAADTLALMGWRYDPLLTAAGELP